MNIDSWLKEIEKIVGEDVQITVFANKCDIEDEKEIQVTEQDIKTFMVDHP